jgi:hypothetical protein
MRRILARLVPMLALVAGLTLVSAPQAMAAKTTTASSAGGAQPLDIWCC